MLPKFDSRIKILVIGDIMVDHYVYGDCNRISPEAPVPVVEFKSEQFTLGGAGNVLKNIMAFGASVDIISVVGNDSNAVIVFDELINMGISTSGIVKDPNRCTTIKSRILSINHQLIRLDKENIKPIDNSIVQRIINMLESTIHQYSIVLLSDYNKGLLSETLLEKLLKLCHAAKVPTLLDPKGLDFKKYEGISLIKPNKKEATLATGITIDSQESLKQACFKIQAITNCKEVIITMSEEGMAYYTEGILELIPTKALDVIDVTGAGDTVLAALGLSLANNSTLKEACEFANQAAAIVVSKVGSATASLKEIEERFSIQISKFKVNTNE
ncbi:D-glycero-beta-D-manno-heptose-7-phosphate kinase [Parasediminibacterium paludis]|uniref:D-glycero-beta-D-manno-heptose-7-phosphate kinase n=1 Tax=Parasediminibacterium paludis TaxID=908966 RepID=A0ABV8Q171_9BACT